jgi:type II secretion system (T2SS) protein E
MNLGHIEKLQRVHLADLLVEEGVLDRSTVEDALIQHEAEGKQLGEVLVEREILSDYDLAKLVAMHYGLPYLEVAGFSTKREVVELLPLDTCMRHAILPLDQFGPLLTLAVSEVPSPEVVREIVSRTKLVPTLFVAMRRAIVTILEEEKKRRDSRSTKTAKPAAAKPAAPASEDAEMDVSQAIPDLDLPAVSLKLGAAAALKPGAAARPAPARAGHGGALKWMDDAAGGAAGRKPAPAGAPAPAAKPVASPAAPAKSASANWQTVFDNGDAAVKKPK